MKVKDPIIKQIKFSSMKHKISIHENENFMYEKKIPCMKHTDRLLHELGIRPQAYTLVRTLGCPVGKRGIASPWDHYKWGGPNLEFCFFCHSFCHITAILSQLASCNCIRRKPPPSLKSLETVSHAPAGSLTQAVVRDT